MTDNPYQSPAPFDAIGAVKIQRKGIQRRYRLLVLIGYLTPFGASVILRRLSLFDEVVIENSGLMSVVRALLWTEFMGVVGSLLAIPLFVLRGIYLLALGRFQDTALDILLAVAGFFAAYGALILNPITD